MSSEQGFWDVVDGIRELHLPLAKFLKKRAGR